MRAAAILAAVGATLFLAGCGLVSGTMVITETPENGPVVTEPLVEVIPWTDSGDPTVELVLSGYKCDKCAVVMSEEGRSRDKFGGKDGKGIAKTKCPKCAQKFGSNPLYVLKDSGSAARMESEGAAPAPAAT